MEPESIKIWPFQDAPEEFRRLSQNGGDEDWVAFVPNKYRNIPIGFIEYSNSFDSCADPQVFNVRDGVVFIGSHA